jgi:hypothetical protein
VSTYQREYGQPSNNSIFRRKRTRLLCRLTYSALFEPVNSPVSTAITHPLAHLTGDLQGLCPVVVSL